MTIDASVAHAIHKDLDIVEALPEIQDLPAEQLEPYVEQYVSQMHESIRNIVSLKGEPFLRSNDPAGLCATCLEGGVHLPPRMLLRMCRTIIDLQTLDARFILDTDSGSSLYFVKMAIA